MELFLEQLFAPAFAIMGLSHLVQPEAWHEFFRAVRRTSVAGLIIAMYTLPFGLALVVGHNRWAWDWAVFLTVAGWGMTLKSTVYCLYPKAAEKMLDRVEKRHTMLLRLAGGVVAVFGGILSWKVWTS